MADSSEILEQVFEHSNQIIIVCDYVTHEILYANPVARSLAFIPGASVSGAVCHKYLVGLDNPCPFCLLEKMDGEKIKEDELEVGKRVLSQKFVVSEWKGRKVFIEYAWDITNIRRTEKLYESQVSLLFASIPDAFGIFHLDVTDNVVLGLNGKSRSVESFRNCRSVDQLIAYMGRFIPDEASQIRFVQNYSCEKLQKFFVDGNISFDQEYNIIVDEVLSPCRIHVRLLMNPRNSHLECILYGLDITQEKKEKERMTMLLDEDKFRKKVFAALERAYFCVYYVDLTSGKFRELGHTDVDAIKSFIGQEGDAREKFKVMSEQMVEPGYEQVITDFTNLDTLPLRMGGRESISVRFKGTYIGWGEGQFIAMERDDNGRCISVLWVIRSVSDEVAREEVYKAQLKAAAQKAERASAAKSSFLTRMSHDIRTPLNGILGLLELDEMKKIEGEARDEFRKKSRTAANHLLSLLNDVLEMSKLEDADMVLAEEPFHLYDLLSDVYTIAGLRAVENNVTLDHDCGVSLKHRDLIGSPLYVRQIFLNLLTNAIKYNRHGGSVFCHSEMISETDDQVVYCFHVDDTGIGMSSDFVQHIFEPFAQEHSDARSTYQGSGMGMAIVKRLVDKMNGHIEVHSEEGMGTRFAVTVPFKINHNPLAREEVSTENVSVEGMRVLLVEDNALNMEIAQNFLEDMGLVVTCANNGEEAVKFFERTPEGSLDLILMDLMMPVMNGYDATRRIRLSEKKDGNLIPIIALSANAFAEDAQKCKEVGMNGHLAKPINVAQLKQTLAKFRK